jgi:hypothetical protein
MQIYPHLDRDDTATASVQLSKAEWLSLRKWMATPDQFTSVKFTNGVYLDYRSNGWYVLHATNNYVACKKIRTAISILNKWHREYAANPQTPMPTPMPSKPVPMPQQAPVQAPSSDEPVRPILHHPRLSLPRGECALFTVGAARIVFN